MKLQNKVLLDLEGKPLKAEGEEITLKKIIIGALMGNYEDEKPSGEEKLKRYVLGQSISKEDVEFDLKVEDVTLIKSLIGKMYTTIVVGAAYQAID